MPCILCILEKDDDGTTTTAKDTGKNIAWSDCSALEHCYTSQWRGGAGRMKKPPKKRRATLSTLLCPFVSFGRGSGGDCRAASPAAASGSLGA